MFPSVEFLGAPPKIRINEKRKKTQRCYLLENLKGERCPVVSLAAHPKAFTGCSFSVDIAISLSLTSTA